MKILTFLLFIHLFAFVKLKDEDNYEFPRVIWMFWTGRIPEDVKEMLRITFESLKNFTIKFLSEKNLSNYLETVSFPKSFDFLPVIEKSCYVRICLLEKYGGLWIDPPIIVNFATAVEQVIFEAVESKCQLVTFKSTGTLFIIQIFFLGAPQNSTFVKVYKEEYDKVLNKGLCVKENMNPLCVETKRLNICTPVYLVDLLFAMIIEDENMKKVVLMLPSIRSPQQLGHECKYRRECVLNRIHKYPFIKFFNLMRNEERKSHRIYSMKKWRKKNDIENKNVNYRK